MARIAATRAGVLNIGDLVLDSVSPDIDCHQGVAVDTDYIYGFDSTAIFKYDKVTNVLVASNTNAASQAGVTHLGDGQVYGSIIYVAAENFVNDTTPATNKRISMFNKSDLSYISSFTVTEMDEIASVCADENLIYAVSYNTGGKIFKYARSNGAYQGTIQLNITMKRTQGISLYMGNFVLARGTSNKLYFATMYGYIYDVRPLYPDVGGGELEGIDFTTGVGYVLHDAGTPEVVKKYLIVPTGRQPVRNIPAALRFNATTSMITLAQGSGLPLYKTTGYTVAGWIYPRFKSSSSVIFGEGNSTTDTQFLLIDVLASNRLRIRINNDASTTLVNTTSDIAFPRNQWIPFVWSDNGGVCFLMTNGNIGSQNFNYSPTGTVTFNRTAIGTLLRGAGSSFYAGALSHIKLFDYALTEDQARTFMQSDVPGNVRNYQLEEGSGSIATDTSANASSVSITSPSWTTNTPSKTRATSGTRVQIP